MSMTDYIAILGEEGGLTSADSYNTAWVARVPDVADPARPAWPQALIYLQQNQLADGGWGDPHIYYAHERTISTLAAMQALLEWGEAPHGVRISRGVEALHRYAADLDDEPHEPIGFELLLPRLAQGLERYDLPLPREAWKGIEVISAQKSALIGSLKVQYDRPRSWWFNLEMLPQEQLIEIDERILNEHGAVAISPAATAAYLRALRLDGRDAPRSAAFLERVLALSGGGAGVCYPIEGFEIMWTLDNYLRAGLSPAEPGLRPMLDWLYAYWQSSSTGMSHSRAFPVDDGDDTAVAYRVLRSAGLAISDSPLLRFWDDKSGQFYTYLDERDPSISSAVHALFAFRQNAHNRRHKEIADVITDRLRQEMDRHGMLRDKWHASPLYATTRAIEPLIGWDDELACRCIEVVLAQQLPDGGWGQGGSATLEETALAVLGLVAARRCGLLRNTRPLTRAAQFLAHHAHVAPIERLWIGKGLYRPVGVVNSLVDAARRALQIEEISVQSDYQLSLVEIG
jgi:hypothetical protein